MASTANGRDYCWSALDDRFGERGHPGGCWLRRLSLERGRRRGALLVDRM